MAIISASPQTRVFIGNDLGGNLLNCTNQFVDFSGNNDLIQESGILKTTAQLTLTGTPVDGFTESLDPRVNGFRWNKGNTVFVETFQAGVWVTHERGRLRILTPPKVPNQGEDLVLSLGCDLTYSDRPAQEESKPLSFWALWRKDNPLRLLNNVEKREAINGLAAIAGVPALVDEIPGLLAVLPRNIDGSYVQAMGAIAFSSGYYLWIDAAGDMRAARPNFTRTPDYVRSVLSDAIDYNLTQGAEIPPNSIEVRAPRTVITNLIVRSKDFTVSVGDEEIDSTGDDENSTKISRKTRKSLFPLAFPSDSTLIIASRTTVRNIFEADSTGTEYLRRTTEESEAPRALVLPNLYSPTDPGGTALIPVSRVVTSYNIVEGITRSIKVERFEPELLVFPSSEDPSEDLIISFLETQVWEPYLDGHEKTTTITDLKSGQSDSNSEYEADSAPPSPTKKEPTEKSEQDTVEGAAEFDQADDPNNVAAARKKRVLSLTTQVSSAAEVNALAEDIGKVFYGRAYPAEWSVPYAYDAAYQPFRCWQWAEPDGLTVRYLADGDAWAITPDEAQYSAQGLYLGRMAGGALVAPYRVVAVSGGVGSAGGTRWQTVATGSLGGVGTGSAIPVNVWQTVATGQSDGATDPLATGSTRWQTVATGSVGAPGSNQGNSFSNTLWETVVFASAIAPVFSQKFLSTIIGGRIGLLSGDPNSGFPGASSTLFYSPAQHDEITLPNADGSWEKYNFIETSLAVTLFTNLLPSDIYVRWNSATNQLVLERVNWTDAISRAVTPLAKDAGWIHPDNPTWRWVGAAVRVAGVFTKSPGAAHIWNAHNPILTSVQIDPTGQPNHVYTATDYRLVANNLVFSMTVLQGGLTGASVPSFGNIVTTGNGGLNTSVADVAIGIDSTTTPANKRNSSVGAGSRRPANISYLWAVNISTPLLIPFSYSRINLLERGSANVLVVAAQSDLYIETTF